MKDKDWGSGDVRVMTPKPPVTENGVIKGRGRMTDQRPLQVVERAWQAQSALRKRRTSL